MWEFLKPLRDPIASFEGGHDIVRLAAQGEMESIYLMGYDAWGGGGSIETYLQACRTSEKYRRGTWYVFSDLTSDTKLSSFILYDLSHFFNNPVLGIGSIATAISLRRKGHCFVALQGTIRAYSTVGFAGYVLFADSDTSTYADAGFVKTNNTNAMVAWQHGSSSGAKLLDLVTAIDSLPYF